MEGLMRALLLQDYNTRVVLLGTIVMGISSGVVGTLLLMRKRALIGDVASHAALPGVAFAYLLMERWQPGGGRWFPGLLMGATVSAALGLVCTQVVRRIRRIHDDAALAITLSLFFGLGVVLFTMIQGLPFGQSAGLSEFVFGKAALMVANDVWLIGWAALLVLGVCTALRKEFTLLCFDSAYAAASGWPVGFLDLLLTLLVICMSVLGMQSVGLLLVVAMLVLPAAAAQFWTRRLTSMQLIAAACGGLSAGTGVLLSAAVPRLAAGAVIVLSATAVFLLSLVLGKERGLFWQWQAAHRLRLQIGRDDLLRSCYEILEQQLPADAAPDRFSEVPLRIVDLLAVRSWDYRRLSRLVGGALRAGWLRLDADGHYRLTGVGRREAHAAVRRHRLWEHYLIEHMIGPPESAHQNADAIEHLLRPEEIEELEGLWPAVPLRDPMPSRPLSGTNPELPLSQLPTGD